MSSKVKCGFIEFAGECKIQSSVVNIEGVNNEDVHNKKDDARDLDVAYLLSTFAPSSGSSMQAPEVDPQNINEMKRRQLQFASKSNSSKKTLMFLNVPAYLIPQDFLAFLGGCLR